MLGNAPEKPHPLISVIIPCYRCASCLEELYRRLKTALEVISPEFEVLFVNDCSPDRDWAVIDSLARSDQRVRGIDLSRNFGQHHAITAGIDNAFGQWVIVMDGDLQDQPEEIPKLYTKAMEGFDVVFGIRIGRTDSFFKKFASRAFSKVSNFLSGVQVEPNTGNFSVCSQAVISNYRRLREGSRSFGLGVLWCGFRTAYVPINHGVRYAGRSSYNLRRSLRLAVESISSHSNKPLRLSIQLGFIMSMASMMFALWLIIRYITWGVAVSGWTSVMVSLYFIGGMLTANLGVVGLYLGKVFDESKRRPLYIVRQTLNFREADASMPMPAAVPGAVGNG